MLVLSRKEQETLHIGDDVQITVLRITPTRVSIGVIAPDGVTVLRGELVKKTEDEQ